MLIILLLFFKLYIRFLWRRTVCISDFKKTDSGIILVTNIREYPYNFQELILPL